MGYFYKDRKKYYKDRLGRLYPVFSKKIYCTKLYFLADLFEGLKVEMLPLVDDATQRLLLELSDCIYEQVPHLDCDSLTGFYIVEEGYKK